MCKWYRKCIDMNEMIFKSRSTNTLYISYTYTMTNAIKSTDKFIVNILVRSICYLNVRTFMTWINTLKIMITLLSWNCFIISDCNEKLRMYGLNSNIPATNRFLATQNYHKLCTKDPIDVAVR